MNQETGCDSCSSAESSSSCLCPICLGPINQESFLDRCFHKFCYNCIMRWTKVVAGKRSHTPSSIECPLCKTESSSIIHEYDKISFQRNYINQGFRSSFILSKAQKYRLQCYCCESGVLNEAFDVSRYWKSSKCLQQNRWLQNWLQREIQALTQLEDVDIIVHHISGAIESFIKRNKDLRSSPGSKQEEFKALLCDAARPFMASRTQQFVCEVELFLASAMNVEAYDEVYMQQLGLITPEATNDIAEGESQHCTTVGQLQYFFDDDSYGSH